ncbi:hypothetical protein BKA93DRAFT_519898 [Sparassis latifolia]
MEGMCSRTSKHEHPLQASVTESGTSNPCQVCRSGFLLTLSGRCPGFGVFTLLSALWIGHDDYFISARLSRTCAIFPTILTELGSQVGCFYSHTDRTYWRLCCGPTSSAECALRQCDSEVHRLTAFLVLQRSRLAAFAPSIPTLVNFPPVGRVYTLSRTHDFKYLNSPVATFPCAATVCAWASVNRAAQTAMLCGHTLLSVWTARSGWRMLFEICRPGAVSVAVCERLKRVRSLLSCALVSLPSSPSGDPA